MSRRERSNSLVIESLPTTLKHLCQTFDKHVKALNVKYAKCETETDDSVRQSKFKEAELFLESLKVIVFRIGDRIKQSPLKLTRLGLKTDLHTKVMRSVQALIPSGWLWVTKPIFAHRQINIISHILLRVGVNKWNWTLGKEKKSFVPTIFAALATNKGSPVPESADTIRLIETLLKAGASSEPHSKESLIARAEQCQWPMVVKMLAEEDKDQLERVRETKTGGDAEESTPDIIEEDAEQVAKETAQTETETKTETETEPDKQPEIAVVAVEKSATDIELEAKIKLHRAASEEALKVAELKLKEAKESRLATERASHASIKTMEGQIRESTLLVESDDEDYKEPDPEDLIQQEMQRLRDEARQAVANKKNEDDDGGDVASRSDPHRPSVVTRADASLDSQIEAMVQVQEEQLEQPTTPTTDAVVEAAVVADDADADDDDADCEVDYDTDDDADDDYKSTSPRLDSRLCKAVDGWNDAHHEESDSNHLLHHLSRSMSTQVYQQGGGARQQVSPLMHAVETGRVGAAATLIYCGALSGRKGDSESEHFLHRLAEKTEFTEHTMAAMIDVLCSGGVYINDLDSEGRTAMDVALECNNTECLSLLEHHDGLPKADFDDDE